MKKCGQTRQIPNPLFGISMHAALDSGTPTFPKIENQLETKAQFYYEHTKLPPRSGITYLSAVFCSLGIAVLCRRKKTANPQSGDEKRKRVGEVGSEGRGAGKKARKADKEPVINGAKGIDPASPLNASDFDSTHRHPPRCSERLATAAKACFWFVKVC
jgi:hypothetical protein